MSITIKQRFLTQNDCYKSGRTITPNSMQLHTIGTGQNTAQSLASYWNQGGIQACVQYCIDAEQPGLVYQFLPDNRRPWADAGYGNNNSIAVELMQSDYMKYTSGANYVVTDEAKFKADVTRAYNTAVEFFAMKCKEYGWNPQEKMSNGLHRVYSHDEGRRLGLSSAHVDPTHIWNRYGWTMDKFRADVASAMKGVVVPIQTEEIKYKVRLTWDNERSQLGAYVNYDKAVEKANENPGYTVFDLSGKALYTSKGLSAAAVIANQTKEKSIALLSTLPDYKGLPGSKEDYLNKVAEIAVRLYPYTLILPSVVIAQACLQNGYGIAKDAIQLTKRSNLIGQKADLINSTWQDQTVWDGQKFSKRTPEVYNGVPTTITDWFRIFPNYAYSILDYEMFLTHVKKTATQYKYREVVGMTDPEKVITTIRNNGYATGVTYITNNMRIIRENDLTRFDRAAFKLVQEGGKPDVPVVPVPTPSPAPVPVPAPTPTPTPSAERYYRVGSGVQGNTVIGQIGAYKVRENAIDKATQTGLIVFDPDYKPIFWGIKSADKLDKKYSKTYTVKTEAKLRSGPSIDYRVIDTLPVGASVSCYGYYSVSPKGAIWFYVVYKGKVGYVISSRVR